MLPFYESQRSAAYLASSIKAGISRLLFIYTIHIWHYKSTNERFLKKKMSYWCQTPQSPVGKSLLQLVSAIKYLSWEAVEERLKTNPEDCFDKDSFGVTALNHCIRKRHTDVPLPIIERIIEINPGAIILKDKMTGFNALHLAVDTDNLHVVKIILDKCTEAATGECKDGKLPIHFAKSEQVARLLIDQNPTGLGHISKSGHLPLFSACLNDHVPPEVIEIIIKEGSKFRIGQQYSNEASCRSCGGVLVKDLYGDTPIKIIFRRILFVNTSIQDDMDNRLWGKLCIVLKYTYLALHGYPFCDESITIPKIHALIECGANPKIVQYVIKRYPNEVIKRDEFGKTPLSIAASKVDTMPEIIEILLKAEKNNKYGIVSSARMTDNEKRLPLHLAVESGRTWVNGVENIVVAEPLALETRDIKTKMYPFMLAAVPSYKWDNTCYDTIYTLLRAAPHVVKAYCKDYQ
jgi:ankyrin repeat protein